MASAPQVIAFESIPQGPYPKPTGLHAHVCLECGKLRPCYANPCEARWNATKPWTCSTCTEGEQ